MTVWNVIYVHHKYALMQFPLLLLCILSFNCSSPSYLIDKKKYAFILNADTLKFDKLILDTDELKNLKIDRRKKSIKLATNSRNELITLSQAQSIYNLDTKPLSFILFQGEIYDPKSEKFNKIYIQKTLIVDTEIIQEESLQIIGLHNSPQGNILIIH